MVERGELTRARGAGDSIGGPLGPHSIFVIKPVFLAILILAYIVKKKVASNSETK